MKQKKFWIITSVAIFLVVSGCIYIFITSKPGEFLTQDVLVERINSHYYGADSVEILDVVFLGDTHVFVPFISGGRYGTSFWVWRDRSWDLGGIKTIQQPLIWQVEPDDPNTYVVAWNIEPDNDMTNFDIYLMNRRGYVVSNDVHHYIPKVQLNLTVHFAEEEKSYGVMRLPDDWVTFLETYRKVEGSKQPNNSLFFNSYQPSSIYFGWIPYNANGEITFPSSPNGTGRGFGNIHLQFIQFVPEYELE